MTKRPPSFTAVALAVIGLWSCKSDGPGTVDDFCAQYAAAICQVATVCGTTADTCQAYQQAQCLTMAGQRIDGQRRYTPQNAAGCINQLKAAYGSGAPITPATLASIDRACQYVYQGTVGLHAGSCVTDYDCAGPTDGSIVCDAYSQQCAVKKIVAGGQSCGAAGDVCATDFTASVTGPGCVCNPAGTSAAASACTEILPCDSRSRCEYVVNGVYQSPGVCVPRAGAREACEGDSDCPPAAPYCDIQTWPWTCEAGLTFGPAAASCNCVARPCAGTGGAIGSTGGASGGPGGAGGAGGAAGIGGTAGAGNRDGGSTRDGDAASCPPLEQDGGFLWCGCGSDSAPAPACVAGRWTCPPTSAPITLCPRYCSLSPLPPPGCRCDPTNGVLVCTKDGSAPASP